MKNQTNIPAKFHIRKGDTVKVIAGDEKGKTGRVTSIDRKTYRAKVEGLNLVSKHIKPTAQNPSGGIEKQEAPIHLSNLMLVDPATGAAVRTGRKVNESGKLQRYSKKTGNFIPTNNG